MPRLGEVLGAIMADVTHARRIADEEALRVAERYRQEPLLRGLSVPRLRLPDVTIDLPLVVEDHDPGEEEEPADTYELAEQSSEFLSELAREENVDLPYSLIKNFGAALREELGKILTQPPSVSRVAVRQPFANAGELVLLRMSGQPRSPLTPEIARKIAPKLRERIAAMAVKKPAKPSSILVRIRTEDVKTGTDPQSVTRLRLRLCEEGLEWHEFMNERGETTTLLTPE